MAGSPNALTGQESSATSSIVTNTREEHNLSHGEDRATEGEHKDEAESTGKIHESTESECKPPSLWGAMPSCSLLKAQETQTEAQDIEDDASVGSADTNTIYNEREKAEMRAQRHEKRKGKQPLRPSPMTSVNQYRTGNFPSQTPQFAHDDDGPSLHRTDERSIFQQMLEQQNAFALEEARLEILAEQDHQLKDSKGLAEVDYRTEISRRGQGNHRANAPRNNPVTHAPAAYRNPYSPQRFASKIPKTQIPASTAQQNQFVDQIAHVEIPNAEMLPDEIRDRDFLHNFLENQCRAAIGAYEKFHGNQSFDGPATASLNPVGSMHDGFGMKGSDLDLLLHCPTSSALANLRESQFHVGLERLLLSSELGARVFTSRTGEISIRGCERPDEDLLQKLWDESNKREEVESKSTQQQDDEKLVTLYGLAIGEGWYSEPEREIINDFRNAVNNGQVTSDLNRCRERLQDLPDVLSRFRERGAGRFEMPNSAGVRWNIYFRNETGMFNRKLLRCYALCDERVVRMAVFVRAWARKRDVCSTFRGTLSHYGYLLLVLHYAINIASPAVIPNLQLQLQPSRGGAPGNPTTCEGHDVRFWQDEEGIRQAASEGKLSYNGESLGSLLRGFFHYFAGYPDFHRQPFHFRDQAVCIKVDGGLVPKRDLDWVEAKLKQVRPMHDPDAEPVTVSQHT